MRFRNFLVVGLVAVYLLIGGPGSAQGVSEPGTVKCGELASLVEVNRELLRVLSDGVEQKGREIELKKLELAIAYLQFRARKVESLETLLMQANGYRETLAESVVRSEEMIERMEENARELSGPESEEMSEMLEKIRRSTKEIEARLAQTERRAIDFGNQITVERRDLQFLEDFISENLDLGN